MHLLDEVRKGHIPGVTHHQGTEILGYPHFVRQQVPYRDVVRSDVVIQAEFLSEDFPNRRVVTHTVNRRGDNIY